MTTGTSRRAAAAISAARAIMLLPGVPALIIAGCVSASVIAPSQSDVNRVQDKFPGYSLADLHRGQSLYENNCQSCHALKNPASKSEADWNRIVPVMVKKVNRNETVLDKQAEEDIRRYVITMSSAPSH